MARAAATNTGYPSVQKRGNSIRVFFMYKRVRHIHTLPLEPSRNNIKHAVQVRSAALFALKNGSYNEADFFPHSRSAESTAPGERLGELRVDLIATRAVSTVNHYLATFSGFLYWCENNRYCGELGKHRTRFTMSILGPGPMTYEEYQTSKWRNLIRRAEIRSRPPYQTRHTFACWNLTARGNLAFIENQMGHKDYSMLVTVYGRWIDTESSRELERIWEGMQNIAQITPKLHHEAVAQFINC